MVILARVKVSILILAVMPSHGSCKRSYDIISSKGLSVTGASDVGNASHHTFLLGDAFNAWSAEDWQAALITGHGRKTSPRREELLKQLATSFPADPAILSISGGTCEYSARLGRLLTDFGKSPRVTCTDFEPPNPIPPRVEWVGVDNSNDPTSGKIGLEEFAMGHAGVFDLVIADRALCACPRSNQGLGPADKGCGGVEITDDPSESNSLPRFLGAVAKMTKASRGAAFLFPVQKVSFDFEATVAHEKSLSDGDTVLECPDSLEAPYIFNIEFNRKFGNAKRCAKRIQLWDPAKLLKGGWAEGDASSYLVDERKGEQVSLHLVHGGAPAVAAPSALPGMEGGVEVDHPEIGRLPYLLPAEAAELFHRVQTQEWTDEAEVVQKTRKLELREHYQLVPVGYKNGDKWGFRVEYEYMRNGKDVTEYWRFTGLGALSPIRIPEIHKP